MGSQPQLKLPIIQLSGENLIPGTSKWLATCTEVRHSMEEYGCFEAICSKIPLDLQDAIFKGAGELFELPLEVKKQNKSEKAFFDYYGEYKQIPLYESLGIGNPTSLEGTQSFTTVMWPQGNDLFCQSVRNCSEKLVELDQLVMKMLCDSYGLGSYYDYYVQNSEYMFRFFGYRVPEKDETDIGIGPHSDKSFLSIIHGNHADGLQVRTKNGQWIDVALPASSYIVMASDFLMAWSNDRIPSCIHQVIMKEKEKRYTIGIFSFVNGIIHAPQELVDDSHPLQYKPFDQFDFLRFYEGRGGEKYPGSSIKEYCGV